VYPKSLRRRSEPAPDPVFTVVCVGMGPEEISDSIASAGIDCMAVCVDSLDGFSPKTISTDGFICIRSRQGIGWLCSALDRQSSLKPAPPKDVVYDVAYDARRSERPDACPSVAVIVTVYNRPDVVMPCLESILDRTRYPFRDLLIMDDASDDYTLHRINSISDARVRVFSGAKNKGYLAQANAAMEEAYKACDYAVLVNSDVVVTTGWLAGMVECALTTGADLVNPLCNNAASQSIPFAAQRRMGAPEMAGGRSYLDAAFAVGLHSPSYPDAVPSIGECLLISKKAWREHGPFDGDLYGTGYGEECEVWAKAVSSGMKAKIADNVYVYHESHATHGDAAPDAESSGFKTFISRHDKVYTRAIRRSGSFDLISRPHREKIASVGARSLPVGFVANDIGPWGGVMCILRLVEGLDELGFDCGLGYMRTSRASSNQGNIVQRFGPYKFRSPIDYKNWPAAFGWNEGLAFATHFHSVDLLESVVSGGGITSAAFWQDREDFFEDDDGNRTVQDDVRDRYAAIPNRIVNAKWVAESAYKDLGVSSFEHIPVGVDTDLFYPDHSARKDSVVRIVSMWRPITKRRGHSRMLRIYRRLKKELGPLVSLEVYGQEKGMDLLEGIVDVHHGWMSQRALSDLLRGVDIVLEPSDFQGFGLPGLEAMASGCFLVSTDNHGVHEYGVHGENCVIASTDDEIVESIVSAAEDPTGVRAIMDDARRTALRFDWRGITARWAEEILMWDVNWPKGHGEACRKIMGNIEKARRRLESRT
jgi:GT2 family glycosyltransferase